MKTDRKQFFNYSTQTPLNWSHDNCVSPSLGCLE